MPEQSLSMEPAADPKHTRWDTLVHLPRQNWISIGLVLAVAGLNAFNDNILKMMLVGLAPKVANDALGNNIGAWLGAVILLPYIALAPIAGWFSDRYSKRAVLMAMLIMQAGVLLLAGATFNLQLGRNGVLLALVSFLLLAVQSTIFSPAKMGVLKELAGSRRLGMVAGWLQMITMLGILGGLWIGGEWFDWLFARSGNAWTAAAQPIWILFGVAMVALLAGWIIQPTPSHPEARFHASLLWEHFSHLGEVLHDRPMRRAFLGNAAYWFVASMVAAMFVDIGLALHPDTAAGGAASASSRMTLMVGLGTAAGSIFVSWVNRRGLQLGMVPLGALGMTITLAWAGFSPIHERMFDWSLMAVGFAGGCYLVPMQAYIQDRADPVRRGRVLSSMNLLDSVAGVVAVMFLLGLKHFGVGFRGQFCALAALMLVATIYTLRILPQDLIRMVTLWIIRSVYKVRAVHADRIPRDGGVLLLPNHVTYVDAFILSAACERHLRFVIWDVFYHIVWFNGVLRLFGTVPISPTKAKDAIRTVAGALKSGDMVCLFPEGRLTRVGALNEVRKGFELMARQGDAPVVPAYMDGLWGSIFSFQSGRFFTKWPKKLRYPVTVYFGEPIAAKEATTERVWHDLLALSSEAFLARKEFEEPALPPVAAHGLDEAQWRQVLANAMRLAEVEWARRGDTLLAMDPETSMSHHTLAAYAWLADRVRFAGTLGAAEGAAEHSVIAVGSAHELAKLASWPLWSRQGRMALCWDAGLTSEEAATLQEKLGVSLLQGWMDEETGALIALNLPDPVTHDADAEPQRGNRGATLGRLLPGFRVESDRTTGETWISGLHPKTTARVGGVGIRVESDGFVARV